MRLFSLHILSLGGTLFVVLSVYTAKCSVNSPSLPASGGSVSNAVVAHQDGVSSVVFSSFRLLFFFLREHTGARLPL